MSFFAVWSDRLLCEQTNEIAHEGEATLGMAWNITAIEVSEHFEEICRNINQVAVEMKKRYSRRLIFRGQVQP